MSYILVLCLELNYLLIQLVYLTLFRRISAIGISEKHDIIIHTCILDVISLY
jgi:hypothetical protein